VTTADARSLAIVALVAVAPIVVVLLFAILRGYTVTLHMTRDHKRSGNGDSNSN
jgi:hypothetical protein